MKEIDWNTCEDPRILLRHSPGKPSPRKLRLFAAGACRLIGDCLTDEMRELLTIAELFADGESTPNELQQARQRSLDLSLNPNPIATHARGQAKVAVSWALAKSPDEAASRTTDYVLYAFPAYLLNKMSAVGEPIGGHVVPQVKSSASLAIADLFRDVFRDTLTELPVPTPPRTDITTSIAEHIYRENEFAKVPILGDALEEAGCDEEILAHCRRDQFHARGCWVVDAILKKSSN